MKRRLTVCLALFTSSSVFVGCGDDPVTTTSSSSSSSGSTSSSGVGGEAGTGGSAGAGGNGGAAGAGGSAGAGGMGGSGGSPMIVCGDGTQDASEACDDGNTNGGDGCDASCAVEMGYSCSGSPSVCTTTCGDGVQAGAEACDDSNTNDNDGCDSFCATETGYSCSGTPSVCVTTCGDGTIAGSEVCDDGNANAGDGCSDTCGQENGYACSGQPSTCITICGDGFVAGLEECDDGNTIAGDGCDAVCVSENGFVCTGQPSTCNTVCGDGFVAGAEACDDGNMSSADGCDAACAQELGYGCTGQPSVCVTTCGDGFIAGMENCDDGNANNNDGCNSACTSESGYACMGQPSTCATICGDGLIVGGETCDDGNTANGDGCNSMCVTDTGYACTGLPSVCATVCGDGIIAGAEACDDSNMVGGDGCSDLCAGEIGFTCTGMPSVCATTCGDGIIAGGELCDDGNTANGDGCNSFCLPSNGENCTDTMAIAQAIEMNGTYTWNIPASAVTTTDGEVLCDPNTKGPDVVIAFTKTSDSLANGGKLLHVKADTPSSTATGNYLNLEIKNACEPGMGKSHKCLWYKDNWDAYLDLPAGTYYIWVQKNSTGTFPAVQVIAEEIAPSAGEGEGCFAPYTSSSSNYTPPAMAGLPHTWSLPPSINSFDMGPTWGEPGSMSCDNTATYGDIHGVDAVIKFDKQSPTSVLKVDVQNTDPTITQSDLDVEVLNVCDPSDALKISRNCRANLDTISMTAPSPAGDVYLWVSTEATGEEFNGATVQVTEIFPGIGESWPTAEPLTSSGPIVATSTQRLDAPTCFAAGTNIHWFSYTLTNDAVTLQTNAAGTVGIYDENGQQLACGPDFSLSAVGALGAPGQTYYMAVASPTTITNITIADIPYSGVGSIVTDMNITFPSSTTADTAMAVDGSQIVLSDTVKLFAFSNVVGATAAEYGTAQGIAATHLGYDTVFVGGSLFGVDSTTTTNINRLARVYDGMTWGPGLFWDLMPTYQSTSPTYALATDGTSIFMMSRRTSGTTDFYSVAANNPSTPVLLGTAPNIYYGVGFAVDNQYFYVASNGASGEGVYRVTRANIAAAATKIATLDTSTTGNGVEVDAFVNPQNLYVRAYGGDTHAIVQPASATPVHIGAINTLGTTSDYAMTYDKANGALYIYETETDSAGRIVRIE